MFTCDSVLNSLDFSFHFSSSTPTYSKKKAVVTKAAVSKAAASKRKRSEEEEDDEDDDNKSGSDNDSNDNDSNNGNDSDDDDDNEDDPPKKSSSRSSSGSKKSSSNAKDDKKNVTTSGRKIVKKELESSSSDRLPKSKRLRKVERLEEARKSFKWWEAAELPDGLNWRKLEHAGISFAPPYVKHGIPMKYDGKILHLSDVQEEMASHYAALPDDGPQLGIPKTRVVFQKNFFDDFKKTFPAGNIMKKFEKCDFTSIKEHLDLQKSLRKAATDEEKAVKKAEKEVVVLQFGYCLIDGRIERVSNFRH